MFEAFKKYAVFSGRARRREYWLFALLYFIVLLAAIFGDGFLGTLAPEAGLGILSGLALLIFLIPSLSVGVRRLHDTDRSGWWLLIGFVPFIGSIVLLVFACMDGTKGDNRFGPDPKALENAAEVF